MPHLFTQHYTVCVCVCVCVCVLCVFTLCYGKRKKNAKIEREKKKEKHVCECAYWGVKKHRKTKNSEKKKKAKKKMNLYVRKNLIRKSLFIFISSITYYLFAHLFHFSFLSPLNHAVGKCHDSNCMLAANTRYSLQAECVFT